MQGVPYQRVPAKSIEYQPVYMAAGPRREATSTGNTPGDLRALSGRLPRGLRGHLKPQQMPMSLQQMTMGLL